MSQDPQGRSSGSPEWEAMGWDPFPDTKPRPAEDRTESRGKGAEDETERAQREGQVYWVHSITFVWGGALAPWQQRQA